MNREQVAKIIPLLQAFMEGKTLQYNHPGDGWDDVKTPNIDSIVVVPERWRIKPRRFTVMVPKPGHPSPGLRPWVKEPDDTTYDQHYWEEIERYWEEIEVVEEMK